MFLDNVIISISSQKVLFLFTVELGYLEFMKWTCLPLVNWTYFPSLSVQITDFWIST